MNRFKVEIENVQNIKQLEFEVNLNRGKVVCIVGENGVGKTTFIKSIANLLRADIFKTTSSPYIFEDNSKITYLIDEANYTWSYNANLQTIDGNNVIPDSVTNNIIGELPLPHGERFGFFQKISNIDKDIREKYITENYSTPNKLVDWYKKIYNSDKFKDLKEVDINGEKYYFLPKENNKYIREDYFSSGEYFILSIYRLIQQQKKLIVIDELDISLDAGAQVHLIKELRGFCKEQLVTLIFTTHSLAIMKMLEDNELFYFKNDKGACEIKNLSYNHIKSILYQFEGWDKYILTEDQMLVDFIEYLLNGCKPNKKHIVIKIGPATSVVALMKENKKVGFFSKEDNVISVLDGDEEHKHDDNSSIIYSPLESVEKELSRLYKTNKKDDFFKDAKAPSEPDSKGKDIFNIMKEKSSQNSIFEFVTKNNKQAVEKFKNILQGFINQRK